MAYATSIFEIDYDYFKQQGITTLFFDLDNTIIHYDETQLDEIRLKFLQNLSQKFKVLIISNSRKARVKPAVGQYFEYVSFATKPFKRGFKKALKQTDSLVDKTIVIGDQLLTDILGANKLGIKSILVKPVASKTDRIYTRFNRRREEKVIKKIKNNLPEKYQEVILPYEAAK